MAGEPTGRAVLVPHAQNHRQPGAGRPGHVGSVQQLDGVRQAGVQERQVRAYLPDRHPGLPDASEEEVNGLVMDPLKAYHTVQGVTAREMCHYFFMPEFRNDWESEYSN